MKPYLLSLGAGLLVGVVYSLLGVRSPAPPAIALLGLLGILLGEHAVPLARWMSNAETTNGNGAPEAQIPSLPPHSRPTAHTRRP